MRTLPRIVLTVFAFWAITATALYAGTFIHEYSHFAAHEGFEVPEVRFYDNPEAARQDLVHVETIDHDGRRYRMENVQETTIVLYDDAILYSLTLNLLPTSLYETGSLGATFLHATPDDTPSIIAGAEDAHWGAVMGAPLVVAVILFMLFCTWIVVHPDLFGRAMLVAYAAELGNNAHHAPAVGLDSTGYAIVTEILFGLALVTAILLSPTYRGLLVRAGSSAVATRVRRAQADGHGAGVPAHRGGHGATDAYDPQDPHTEAGTRPTLPPAALASVRFRHVRSGPPTPGRASPNSVTARRWGS